MIGDDHVTPRSVERTTATSQPLRWRPEPCPRNMMSTRSPFGRTTIWLPIENRFSRGAKIGRACSQLAPPFVVRENQMSPRNEYACRALMFARSVGIREHTSELQSREKLVCRLLLEKKKKS